MVKNKGKKLPKKVAGVKIPKGLRKAGEAAKDLAQQPVISELVAAALTAAAASLSETKTAKAARRETADAASDTMKEVSAIGSAVKRVLLDAARELLDSIDDAVETGEKTLARSEPAKSKPSGKKKA